MGMKIKHCFHEHTSIPTESENTHLDAPSMMSNTSGSDLQRLFHNHAWDFISPPRSQSQGRKELPILRVVWHTPLTLCLAVPYPTVKACPCIHGPSVQPDCEMSNPTRSKTTLSVAISWEGLSMSETPFLLRVAVFALRQGPVFAFSLSGVCFKDSSSLGINTHSESGIPKVTFIPSCITNLGNHGFHFCFCLCFSS